MTTLIESLGPAVMAKLEALRNRGWSLFRWMPREDAPAEIVGAAFMWHDDAADVVVLRSHLMGSAYRAMPSADCFDPLAVTLYDMAAPTRLLDTVLTWDPYGNEFVQREAVRPPPGLVLPRQVRGRYMQMMDMPHNPQTIVAPPFYNTT